jgi:hypothetical protein
LFNPSVVRHPTLPSDKPKVRRVAGW